MLRNISGTHELLIDAAIDNSATMVKDLIKAGADAKFKDRFGRTAIIWAAIRNNAAMVKHLIEAGADANVKDRFGRTPNCYAAQNNNAAMVKYIEQTIALAREIVAAAEKNPLLYQQRNFSAFLLDHPLLHTVVGKVGEFLVPSATNFDHVCKHLQHFQAMHKRTRVRLCQS